VEHFQQRKSARAAAGAARLEDDMSKFGAFAVTVGFSLGLGAASAAFAAAPAKPAVPAVSTPSTIAGRQAVEPNAVQALKDMSAYLATLPAFELTSDTTLDLVTNDGQRVQVGGTASYKARRPNGLSIEVDSDLKKRRFFYDGKTFTVSAPELGYYAKVAAPPTIRQLLDIAWTRYGIALPLEDLFRWNDPSSAGHVQAFKSAFSMGLARLGGADTDQYVFREDKVDWQIWIQRGDKPLPLKVVIVDRSDPAGPAYTARLTWNTSPSLSDADFAFQPGKDDKLIKLSSTVQ
jgi:hypothetical protein